MGNTMAMTVRERTKEVGTLKAIGFKRHTIAGLFVGESVLIALVGAAIGIGFAVFVYRSVDLSLYLPNLVSFVPTSQTLIAAFALAVIVAIVSVAYSTYRVTGLTIAEALRSTE
jgi:putative ABC transport system permease protein